MVEITTLTISVPQIGLGDSEKIQLDRFTAPAGATLKIWVAGIYDHESDGSLSSLTVGVYNNTDVASEYSISSTFIEGSPLYSNSVGGDDIEMVVKNDSGQYTKPSAFMVLEIVV